MRLLHEMPIPFYRKEFISLHDEGFLGRDGMDRLPRLLKVSGPFVETSCVFQCIKNIINAEMWA